MNTAQLPGPALKRLADRFAKMLRPNNLGAPRVPRGECIYAVGDIHGRADLLDALLSQIESDAQTRTEKATVIFLGDYVDRGPNSRGVIEKLLEPTSFQKRFLLGNHDQALLDFLDDSLTYRAWKSFGAQETLLSYGVRPPRFDDVAEIESSQAELRSNLPVSHLEFFSQLELCAECGDYFFAHAGVRPGILLSEQKAEDLLWIRDEFLQSDANFGKIVVHGHTPTDAVQKRRNRIGIDTGAYATGRLSALVLFEEEARLIQT